MPAFADASSPITFLVPGLPGAAGATRGAQALPAPFATPLGLQGTVKSSHRIGALRGAGELQRVEAVPGADVVVLHLANGPSLVLHPATARDLMLSQAGAPRATQRGAAGEVAQAAAPLDVLVPSQLRWQGLEDHAVTQRGATRGLLGEVLLSAIEVITGPLRDAAEDFAADQIVARVDGQVHEAVYALDAEHLPRLKGRPTVERMTAAPDGGPTLVFVHGTFSDTSAGFGKLWQLHPKRVRALFTHYRDRVYALDHATLGRSPIENAYTLALACPPGARLHLVTHSRGGLVAEVLARAANLPQLDAAAHALFRVDQLPDDRQAGLDAAGRAAQQQALDEQKRVLGLLIEHLASHDIRVERVVRAACPARGTLLASQRFDAYLSVFRWALELAQIPVLPELVDFIGGVAQRRADPNTLPGVAAMVPDSPLVRWLHAAEAPVPGELRVIAGDLEGDSLGSWLKTLTADAFFWTDNDLVVQTRSMYGGAPRERGASFVLDQGGRVTHFNYFANERTAEAVVSGLTQAQPEGWRPIGALSAAGEAADGLRGGADTPGAGLQADRPAVFVLPGILGSHLKVDGERIWLGWRLVNGLKELAYPEPAGRRVEPDGPVGSSYDRLSAYLSRSHEVIAFAYDWRKPLEEEARRLGRAVEQALDARDASGQPVRLLAHSMGGLLARTLQLECPAVWDRLMARPGARLLMLGTPNAGSWAPMQVLSGDDTFGNALVAFGAPFQDRSARRMMAQFPGFIQLQTGLLDDPRRLDLHSTWKQLATDDVDRLRSQNWWHDDGRQITVYEWGVPQQAVLDAAKALHERLARQVQEALPGFRDRLALVVGRARFTPDGYEIGNEGLVYLNAPEAGDGRVTLHSACLPGVRTWTLDCEHGALPDERDAFDAYLDLLVEGSTARLPVLGGPGDRRGSTAPDGPPAAVREHVRSRPARERSGSRPPPASGDVIRRPLPARDDRVPARGTALPITLHNGDLSFVRHPLMVGHYSTPSLTGTERVVDRMVGGTMRESLALGQYPEAPGTHQLFVNLGIGRDNPLQLPRPESVIVVGLGEEGKLQATDLAYSVKLGALSLAQRLIEKPDGVPLVFELAATLLGSGGAGISAGQAAQLIAQGIHEADQALRELNERSDQAAAARRWPRIGHLHLIELYLDRASEAWRALQVQAQSAPGQFALSPTIESGVGALRRPLDGGYRGADYDYIRAASAGGDTGGSGIEYTLDTKRARAEVRAQSTQARLVRELVAKASNDQNRDTQIGRTLFQLLVPVEMEPYLGGSSEVLLELDRGTAGIPWEMLDTDSGSRRSGSGAGGDGRPWAIRSKLLRKLRLADYRQRVHDAGTQAHVLVIGEPQCPTPGYPRLAGARAEARAVRDLLAAPQALGSDRICALISDEDPARQGPDAREVINALMQRDWRIVHIAGHGEPPETIGPEPCRPGDPAQAHGNPRGVVLSNGTFLGPREIRNMRVVPELVFVNCCHLAARSLGELLVEERRPGYDRADFASGVAEELIRIGVRCVIAAGWAVEDEPAQVFATTFYASLLRGRRFIDAVALAREAALDLGGNTWAAYQCYGDPDWVFQRDGADPQTPSPSLGDEFASVNSPAALALALETLVVRSHHQGAAAADQRARIRHLEARFEVLWGGMGAVAEAFALAWDAAGDIAMAIGWYERALAANDGSASMKASEQLGNLRVKLAWRRVETAAARLPAPAGASAGRARRTAAAAPRRRDRAELAAAQAELATAIDESRAVLSSALILLRQLVQLQPTLERHSLCGSAFKRLAMIERVAQRPADAQHALRLMRESYEAAENLGLSQGDGAWFYPALNRVAADVALADGRAAGVRLDPQRIECLRQRLAEAARDAPDFWSVVSLTELRLLEALAGGRLSHERAGLSDELAALDERMRRTPKWGSVLDQLQFVLAGTLSPRAVAAEREAARALIDQVSRYLRAATADA